MILLSLLSILLPTVVAQYDSPSPSPSSNYCAAFVECAAVSLLEERLCLGNSLWRPYWLPERRDTYDCHQKLKNDYTTLERLEEELDGQLVACMNENSAPLDKKTDQQCQLLPRPPRFSFSRTITYVPNHCFTGVKRRVERQCGQLAKCCPSIEKCKILSSDSTLQKMINTTRTNLRKRADDCKKGMSVAPIILDGVLFSEDPEKTWAPTGHVNVRFTDEESKRKQAEGQIGNGQSGFVNVRFTTQQENEEKARKLLIRYGDKEGDGLTLPKLSYPLPSKKPGPQDFETKFNAAMKKTDGIKQRIEELDRAKIAKEGFDSLLDAATVVETINSAPPMGTVTLLESSDDNIVVEDNGGVSSSVVSIVTSSESVTTSPIIFVEKIAVPQKNDTIERCRVSTSIRFSNILKMLGESPTSKDLKEVKGLVDKFESKLKGKDLSDKQRNKAKLIEKSLEMLLENFDDKSYEKVEKDAEAVMKETEDLPVCPEIPEASESIDDAAATMLVDDNGDKFIIQKGATTLIVGGGEGANRIDIDDDNSTSSEKGYGIQNFVSEEYKAEIEAFRRQHSLWTFKDSNISVPVIRNETTCDMYMRCRSQMHLAVDSCAWRFASDQLLATMAESAESLLFKDDGVCSQKDGDKFVELYENMIQRNNKLRECLDEKNEEFFEESVCLAYPEARRHQYDDALRRLLNSSFEYAKSRDCFQDANLIQEKCTHLRDCCPNFDECREETFEVEMERTIIALTANINENKQECVKRKAKEAVKNVVRQLLLDSAPGHVQKQKETIAQLGLDISRGARVVRMAKYRA